MRRCIVVGCGGRGSYWTNRVLANLSDEVEVVGLVDVQQEPLDQGAEWPTLQEPVRRVAQAVRLDRAGQRLGQLVSFQVLLELVHRRVKRFATLLLTLVVVLAVGAHRLLQ